MRWTLDVCLRREIIHTHVVDPQSERLRRCRSAQPLSASRWRDLWLSTLLTVPLSVAVGVLFSGIGNGVSERPASITVFLWIGLLAWRLMRLADGRTVGAAGEAVD